MARINLFQNIIAFKAASNVAAAFGSVLYINHVYIPGSISFNTVAVLLSQTLGNTASTGGESVSVGLCSLNGATLSLANSASGFRSISQNQSSLAWLTLATSATQDITPGDWFLAFVKVSTNTGSHGFIIDNGADVGGAAWGLLPGGPFFRGHYKSGTNALPGSIATSDCSVYGQNAGSGSTRQPYILIAA